MTTLNTYQQTLEVGVALVARGWTVSCAESCTGGGLAATFTEVSGSSAWFNLSWVTYSNEAKHRQLGVPERILTDFGAVSAQTVVAMADGAAKHANAEVAVAISGIAGPGGGTTEKPVGLVWFGFHLNGETIAIDKHFTGDRKEVREQAVRFAIAYLYQRLVENGGSASQ